jgi:DNA-binding MarR family transcriptional regulator
MLVFGGRTTFGELARLEQVSLPTMTRIAAALVKAGYVKRTVDPNDRRFVYLEATRRGVALLDEGRRRRVERVESMLSTLDAAELAACARALAVLASVLDR